MNQALQVLLNLVAAGHDFAASLKAVADRFNVNPDWLGYEFDRANDDQWRDQ
jgi:hypothetical protein